jgi:seryl-tRNA synthetase
MLDAKLIRNEPEKVRQALINRNEETTMLERFLELDEKRRKALFDVEHLKAERNSVSEHIAGMKKAREDAPRSTGCAKFRSGSSRWIPRLPSLRPK